VSVVRLYAAAMLPGLLLAGLYVLYVIGRAIMNPRLAPKLPREETQVPLFHVIYQLLTSFFPLAVLIVAVLGAILFGFATPSEAAAVGALGGLLLAAAYGALSWVRLKEATFLTARTTAMVCYLFIGSWTFSSVFSYLGGHHVVEQWVLGMELSPVTFLIIAQLIIFLLGWPLEWTEIIIIFVPIFLPLLPHFNVDPIFFGVLVALNLQTSFLTPPMAMSAYYLKGIAPPHIQLIEIFRGCMPFLLLVFLSMVMVYNFTGLVEWLPSYIYGR
jgi:tripartite ATP-independent transporter DctM subunit